MTKCSAESLKLYLVADPDFTKGEVIAVTQAAIENGVTMVQLRWKSATDRQLVRLATSLLTVCQSRDVPLVINDRVDIALAVGAQGVHLGIDDLPVELARRVAGHDFIVGYSPDTDVDIQAAADRGATYLGIGPLFDTATKSDAGPALGLVEFRRRRELTDLPVVAIGGISSHNATFAIRAGAVGVAVVSAILASDHPAEATLTLSESMSNYR